jgi:hypothetical protein
MQVTNNMVVSSQLSSLELNLCIIFIVLPILAERTAAAGFRLNEVGQVRKCTHTAIVLSHSPELDL